MNLNNFTKAELISKIQELKQAESKKIENSKLVDKNKKQSSLTFWDILLKFKFWILSLSFIAILSRVFKNYKSIRALLKIANYIILTMFGISILDAFGLGFIAKFLGELKYVIGGVIAYITESTFYNYLMKMFNVAEEKGSIRAAYKKPLEIDWKAEYEKAERNREIEKWKEKYQTHQDDNKIDKGKIGLLLLLLGGTIATWYYGTEILDIISPVWNMRNIIRRIMRGGDDEDDNNPPTPADIGLTPTERAISPDMLVYSSEIAERKIIDTLPDNHPAKFHVPDAPPAPPAPPAPTIPKTEQGRPSFLNDIELGKKLKPAITKVKDSWTELGGVVGEDNAESSSSKVTIDNSTVSTNTTGNDSLADALSKQFNKMKKGISGDDSDLEDSKSGKDWESGGTTPTEKLDKGKNKFLKAIEKDDSLPSKTWEMPKHLNSIKENFPNLSEETLKKLSTPEGIKNRSEIMNSIPEQELMKEVPRLKNITSVTDLFNKAKNVKNLKDLSDIDLLKLEAAAEDTKPDILFEKISELHPQENNEILDDLMDRSISTRINEILKDNHGMRKNKVVEKIIQENPLQKDKIISFMDRTYTENLDVIQSRFNDKQKSKLKELLALEDLKDRESLSETRNTDQIKALSVINTTHKNLLSGIKKKSSEMSLNRKDNNLHDNIASNDKMNDTMNLFE
jgi:hypothetical protein